MGNRYLAAGWVQKQRSKEIFIRSQASSSSIIPVSAGNVFTYFMAWAYLEAIDILVFPLHLKQFSLLLVGSGFIFSWRQILNPMHSDPAILFSPTHPAPRLFFLSQKETNEHILNTKPQKQKPKSTYIRPIRQKTKQNKKLPKAKWDRKSTEIPLTYFLMPLGHAV